MRDYRVERGAVQENVCEVMGFISRYAKELMSSSRIKLASGTGPRLMCNPPDQNRAILQILML
jgi:hypothetical protein